MTRDRFLAELALTGLTWDTAQDGSVGPIRAEVVEPAWLSRPETVCPLTAVCFAMTGRLYAYQEYWRAAMALGLSAEDALAIERAADGVEPFDRMLRLELARATLHQKVRRVATAGSVPLTPAGSVG